ncbi:MULTISPECIES: recombinase RecT [Aminobacterium]|uniref:recombinase RecT n=1 Tax=Aminobacterium TaxID=81466 RepID=UPI0025805701|nr:recombinase RecT [Aminobacterium sp. UBA4987]
MSNVQIETQEQMGKSDIATQGAGMFGSLAVYQDFWKIASTLARSDMIPREYQKKPENVIIAIEMSQRTGASVFAIMQGMDVIYGRPSWRSQFIISAINTCGRFYPLEFQFFGTEGEDDWGCYAYTKDKRTGRTLKGPRVTIKMAKDEGWYSKKDRQGQECSKWQTMPELMLHYRAAAFFGRLYAPDVLNGMYSSDEVHEIIDVEPVAAKENVADKTVEAVKERIESMRDKPGNDGLLFKEEETEE